LQSSVNARLSGEDGAHASEEAGLSALTGMRRGHASRFFSMNVVTSTLTASLSRLAASLARLTVNLARLTVNLARLTVNLARLTISF
jgi:hypothetical protein